MADILSQPKLNRMMVPLVEQAESHHMEYDHKTEKPMLIQTFDRKKFAELIIRECNEVAKNGGNILDHFGVK